MQWNHGASSLYSVLLPHKNPKMEISFPSPLFGPFFCSVRLRVTSVPIPTWLRWVNLGTSRKPGTSWPTRRGQKVLLHLDAWAQPTVVIDGSSLYSGGTVSRPLCMYGGCFLIKRGIFMAKNIIDTIMHTVSASFHIILSISTIKAFIHTLGPTKNIIS